jgi:hypothetical protein
MSGELDPALSEPVTALSPLSSKSNHLALVGGLPCSATYFAAELCRDLVARKHGACEVVVLNEFDEATIERIAAATGSIVFLSEIPNAAVVEALSRSDFPILMVDQSFSEASLDFIAARDTKLLDTVRTMARAQVGLNALLDIPRSDLLSVDRREPASALAEQMTAILGLDPALCQTMIDERNLGRALGDALDEHFAYEQSPQPHDVVELLSQLDRFYSFHSERREPTWLMPTALFMEAAAPYLPATNSFDLLGPARCLSFGPYLYLPTGSWKSVLTFSSIANRSTNTVGFDVTADEQIKLEENFEIAVDGRFSLEFRFEIEDSYYPFEFRTHLRRGSIEGELRLHSFSLEKCG